MFYRLINREEIEAILTQDSHCRKSQRWPLLTSESFELINSHNNIEITNMMNVKLEWKIENIYVSINDFIKLIEIKYRFINRILDKFRGHLVACGGSIINILMFSNNLNTKTKHSDVDLFFYDLNIEEANKMRMEVICMIIDNWKSYNGEKFIIKRNEFVTSVYVFYNDEVVTEYQLIHRIYPDISSIIGGFDIGACMLAYDGNEIYATPLGAWSLKNRSIIVDTKRRSTSYEHRLVKYFQRGFRIIFPGLPDNSIVYRKTIGSASETEEILKYQIFNLITGCGYKINNINNIMNECSKIQTLSDNDISIQNLEIKNEYNNHHSISLTRYNNKSLLQKSLNKISDYYHDTDMKFSEFVIANNTRLRLGNLKAVSSLILIDNAREDIYDILIKDINDPNLEFNQKSIKYYEVKVETIKSIHNTSIQSWQTFNGNFYKLMKCFGHLTNEALKIKDVNDYDYYKNVMITFMSDNARICKEKLTGIKWIT